MTLRKKIQKIQQHSKVDNLPYHVECVFPEIELGVTGIAFSEKGDFVSIGEAIWALEWLANDLRGFKSCKTE